MLAFIRSKVASIFAKILFFLLIASFAVWGVGDIFRGGQYSVDSPVGEVGDLPIGWAALDREFMREINRMRRYLGNDLDRERARQFGLLDRAFDALVVRALFRLEKDQLGMAVSEDQVRRLILADPSFRDELGAFSQQRFQFVLQQLAGDVLVDSRTGRNGWHGLVGLFRQSVYGRLAGYEDVN